jgi:HEAT repeat protein
MRYSWIVAVILLAAVVVVLRLSFRGVPQVSPEPQPAAEQAQAPARVEALPTPAVRPPGDSLAQARSLDEKDRLRTQQERQRLAAAAAPTPEGLARQQLQALLDGAAANQKLTEGIMQALRSLTQAGGDPAAALREEYQRSVGNVQRASVVLQALKELGTPAAQKALVEIALNPGQDGFTLGARAVEAYAATGVGATDLAALLDSREPQVRDVAIQKMAGLPLDRPTLEKLNGTLNSPSWVTRNLVATALGTDPQAGTAADRVGMLMSSSRTLGDLENAEQILPQYAQTAREMALGIYAGSLSAMPTAGRALWSYVSSGTTMQRSLAAVALARQGDKAAREPVLRVIRETDDGFVRMMAVAALETLATEQDKTLLESLATTDPYQRPSLTAEGPSRYPVRDAARRVLDKLNK